MKNSRGFSLLGITTLGAFLVMGGCSSEETSTGDAVPQLAWPQATGCDYRVSNVTAGSFSVKGLGFAQTHVIDGDGCRWQVDAEDTTYELHLVGNRKALILTEFSGDVSAPSVVCKKNGSVISEISLNAPDQLPATEDNGSKFAENIYSGTLPKECLVPDLELTFKDGGAETSAFAVKVGAPTSFTMLNLPFYLFGASPTTQDGSTVLNLAKTGNLSDTQKSEFFQKLPVATFQSLNHPAQKVQWSYVIIGPRNASGKAYKITNSNQQLDGFAAMSAVMQTLSAIGHASGDHNMAKQRYAPIIMLDQNGDYASPGGGLGGGHRGTGDYSYGGIFFHEQGHAFNIPHVGATFLEGKYPHPGGSLKGSAWGFDFDKNMFLSTTVPSSAVHFANCKAQTYHLGEARQLASDSQCVRQDPMQSGDGDQASDQYWAMFADFNVAKIQSYFEGGVAPYYVTGRLHEDSNFSSGYSRWNPEQKAFEEVIKVTEGTGYYGLDAGIPTHINKEIDTIVITMSFPESFPTESGLSSAPTTGITQIYPPLRYTGNAMRLIDPTNATDMANIVPDTGTYPHFCRVSGCDYTVKLTYSDSTVKQYVLQGGFRNWYWDVSIDSYDDDCKNPEHGKSYKVWGVSVPTDNKTLTSVKLLFTPKVWNGLPGSETVLASYP